jgi:hypothetical protein
MKIRAFPVLIFLLAGVLSVPGQMQSGDIVSLTFEERLSAAEIDAAGVPLFEEFPRPDARYGVDVYEIRFMTRDADGTPIEALGSLHVPVSTSPRRAPVFAFGSGTTGIGNQCAPSLEVPEEIRWGWYRQEHARLRGSGDHHHLSRLRSDSTTTRFPQRYFSKVAEGHVMLDALRAARNAFADYPRGDQKCGTPRCGECDRRILPGRARRPRRTRHERGRTRRSCASTVQSDSVRPTAVEMLMKEAGYYSPYIVYTYLLIYGPELVDPAAILQERWVATL